MLLVLSGASGVGKSTARLHAAPLLGPGFEPVELGHYPPIPQTPTSAWRQETVERIVQHAIDLDGQGRHLLLAGDPVPAGEALAAPSADRIDIAVCLLDADAGAQGARLDARDEPAGTRPLHTAFAEWMRRHAVDPTHAPEVVTGDAWPGMRWDRWVGADIADRWGMAVVDTSHRTPEEVGASIADWGRRAVRGKAPVFRAGWHLA
ncbi:hypothetical protein [Nocardiopsis salina]|uniref:hypothetical protein n=1 Tax=Nocardiopsis salina TaxID=245836 RepID=UPI0003487809|nr:hypothetical protein [Nocardiopsis salina]